MGLDTKACLHRIEWLRERGDLDELGAYLQTIDTWKDAKPTTDEHAVFAGAIEAFKAVIWPKVLLIDGQIKEGQWKSVECQKLHTQLRRCHPMFADYDENTYARVARGEDAVEDGEEELEREWIDWLIEAETPEQEPEDLSGYYSDDSDEEFDEELLEAYDDPSPLSVDDLGFSKATRPKDRKAKKRWLSKRAKAQHKVDARNRKAQTVRDAKAQGKITFRYRGGELEPDPYLLIQRVARTRKDSESRDLQQIAMAGIYHGADEWTQQAEQDFQLAKQAFAKGDVKALAKLKTKFCLAQYRGITFKTSAFDSRARQVSRNENELGRAIYSMSVLHEAGVAPTDYFRGSCSEEELVALDDIAQELKQVLLAKRETDPVNVGGIRFDTQADAIQHIYTNQYDYFHSSVARYLANKDEWAKDQNGGIAKVRQASRGTEDAAKRTSLPVDERTFIWQVAALAGCKADFHGYRTYLERQDLVADEPSFKKAIKAKVPVSDQYDRYRYQQYAARKTPFSYAEYEALAAEFSGYSADQPGWWQYMEDVGERNEVILIALEDEAEAAYVKQKYGFIPPDDWVLFDGLLNGYCPLVSTGDNPRHALKYAYGMKFYSGHYHERLKPGWDANGKARRPYIGKVYASLHTLEDYLGDAPNHVPSMNLYGRITVGDMIADEREATFPAYIPGGRTVVEHIAKIPSFPGDTAKHGYGPAHLHKYGLDEEDFAALHGLLRDAQAQDAKKQPEKEKPDKPQPEQDKEDEEDEGGVDTAVDAVLQRVCAWLVNYQETRLVEIVRRLALAQDRLLVYRNSLGELDRRLSPTVLTGVRLPGDLGLENQDPMELRKLRRYTYTSDPKNKQSVIDKERATWAKPRATLRDQLVGNFTIHATPPDGNCLFHALAGILRLHGDHVWPHNLVRDDLVYEMTNTPAYAGLRGQYGLDVMYLGEMAKVCTQPGQIARWGGDPEIHAFCLRYGVRVRVYAPTYPGPNHYTEFDPPAHVAPRYTGYLLHVNGNHWEYLVPR